jgi:hypothetical protein
MVWVWESALPSDNDNDIFVIVVDLGPRDFPVRGSG